MKTIAKDVLMGLLIVFVITLLEFIVTIPFSMPGEDLSREGWAQIINRELLLTALPAALVTFLFTRLLKTDCKSDAFRRSIVWTTVVLVNFLLIGIGNGNLAEIFGTLGIYALLACAFAGPMVYAGLKHLE